MTTIKEFKTSINVESLPFNKSENPDNKGGYWYNAVVTSTRDASMHTVAIPEEVMDKLREDSSIVLARKSSQRTSNAGNVYISHTLWIMDDAKEADITL